MCATCVFHCTVTSYCVCSITHEESIPRVAYLKNTDKRKAENSLLVADWVFALLRTRSVRCLVSAFSWSIFFANILLVTTPFFLETVPSVHLELVENRRCFGIMVMGRSLDFQPA